MATHNQREIDANELFELIRSISKYIEKEIKMYALGGTALTILKLKKSTRDIDINIESSREYEYICKIFEQLGFERISTGWMTQEGLKFDIFHGSNIMGTELLENCITNAKFIDAFGNIKLFTLPLEDIIISKLARGDLRDFNDIKAILESEDINLNALTQRYKKTMENSAVANWQQKLLDLIEIHFKEWNFKIDKDLINEVKKWQ